MIYVFLWNVCREILLAIVAVYYLPCTVVQGYVYDVVEICVVYRYAVIIDGWMIYLICRSVCCRQTSRSRV